MDTQYIIALAELKKVNKDFHSAMKLYLRPMNWSHLDTNCLKLRVGMHCSWRIRMRLRAIFKELSEKEPGELSYINIYSELALQSKEYNEAIQHLNELNKKYGNSKDRDAKLGILLFESGKIQEGKSTLKGLYDDSQLSAQYIFSLFEMYLDTDEVENAAMLGDKLIADFPEDWRVL